MRNGKAVVFLLEDEEGVAKDVRLHLAVLHIELLWAKTLHEGAQLFDANKDVIDIVVLDTVIWERGFDRPRDGRALAAHIFQACRWGGVGLATSSDPDRRQDMMEMIPDGLQHGCGEKHYLGQEIVRLLHEAGKV